MPAPLNPPTRTLLRVSGALLLALSVSLVFAGATAHQPAEPNRATAPPPLTRVDGISDQNLAHWDNAAFSVASFSSRSFPNIFRRSWVGGGGGHIRFARFVVPWDVMADARGEALHFDLFAAWLADVTWLGLTPDVAIEQAESPIAFNGGELGRIPGSPAAYRKYVGALLGYAAFLGEPVRFLEAWNEPNNTGSGAVNEGHPSAAMAAEFMNTATTLCLERGCTPIAGDFLDSQYRRQGHAEVTEHGAGMGMEYERSYVAALRRPSPTNWGFHPYAAVKYRTTQTLAGFEQGLPTRGAEVWLTEVGVYLCQAGNRSTPAEQADGARYLNRLIDPHLNVTHAFYYELKAETRQQETTCPGASGADTSLYNSTDEPRQAAPLVFGGPIPTTDMTR